MSGEGKQDKSGKRSKVVKITKSELEHKGWYRDEKGRWCFKGQCFDMRVEPDGGILVELDPECEVDGQKPIDALVQALMRGGQTTYRVKTKKDTIEE